VSAPTVDEIADAGGFPVIYADPPWRYADRGCNGAAEKQYGTMSPADLHALPVGRLASKDCALFMWGTYPLLPQMLTLGAAWGFTYKSIAFQWVKRYKNGSPFFGLGRWTRGNTEGCFLFTRGKPQRVDKGVFQLIDESFEPEVLDALIGRHSAKPPEVRDRIVRLMGDIPRVELFARERVPGWECWGNECESTVAL